MFIRDLQPADIPKMEAIYKLSPAKYDLPLLDSKLIESALVMVDDDDEPHALIAAERVAEIFLVMDHRWETPAFRAVALAELAKATRDRMEASGYRAAYAFLGDDVPKGYDRRLFRLGARKMIVRCVQFVRGER
jgi:hypothetical protein